MMSNSPNSPKTCCPREQRRLGHRDDIRPPPLEARQLYLVFAGVALLFDDIRNHPAFRFAGVLIGLPAIAALLGGTVRALIVRDEWHVGHGFCSRLRTSQCSVRGGGRDRVARVAAEQHQPTASLPGPLFPPLTP